MIAEPLLTPRLSVVPMIEAHGEPMWTAAEASLEELKRWMPWAEDASPVAQIDFAVRSERAWVAGERYSFTVVYEDDVCGTIGIDWVDRINSSAKIGYWLRSDLTGRGLMAEAVSAVITFAFDTVELHRLELHAAIENHASRRVAEKLGFQQEGVLRHGTKGSGGFYDAAVYGLLSTDLRPRFHLASA